VLSLLVGCALSERYLRSVDQPVTDFVPELADKGFTAVTLKHLLQMTSDIDYAEAALCCPRCSDSFRQATIAIGVATGRCID
jgi:CubicO group peptidase (beta-lactamase class C family)